MANICSWDDCWFALKKGDDKMLLYTISVFNELYRELKILSVTPFHMEAKMLMQTTLAKTCEEYSQEIYTIEGVTANNINVVLMGDRKVIIKLDSHEI